MGKQSESIGHWLMRTCA